MAMVLSAFLCMKTGSHDSTVPYLNPFDVLTLSHHWQSLTTLSHNRRLRPPCSQTQDVQASCSALNPLMLTGDMRPFSQILCSHKIPTVMLRPFPAYVSDKPPNALKKATPGRFSPHPHLLALELCLHSNRLLFYRS